MANNLKSDPKGVDIQIARMQKTLYAYLVAMLQPDKTLEGFGRVYKNKKSENFVFETYQSSNEYKDVSGLDRSCFLFYVEENVNVEEDPLADVQVVFLLHLEDFYSDGSKRMDEEIKGVAFNALLTKMKGGLRELITGVEHINEILEGFFDSNNAKVRDMHPYLTFTITGEVTYNYKNC